MKLSIVNTAGNQSYAGEQLLLVDRDGFRERQVFRRLKLLR